MKASCSIAAASFVPRRAAPNRYTFAMVGQPHLSNVLLREKKPYDPLQDFTTISLVSSTHNVLRIISCNSQ
jgi:tripartite-type tricarboxylate transporter receptor subunit TctC